MILVLCHPDDAAASWLHATWRARGVGPVALVSVEQVAYSRRITHRVGGRGDEASVWLADGRPLRLSAITGLINRVRHLPTAHFAAASDDDRGYAGEELYAWILAWLDAAGGRAVNRPRPYSLSGGDLPPSAWQHYAAVAGLPGGPWRLSTRDGVADAAAPPATGATCRVVVFGQRTYGALLPRPLQDACRRLALLSGLALLQVDLARDGAAGWQFVAASGLADFRAGGWPLASALASALLPSAVPA